MGGKVSSGSQLESVGGPDMEGVWQKKIRDCGRSVKLLLHVWVGLREAEG